MDLMEHYRAQVVWQNFFATKLVDLEKTEADAETDYETAKAIAFLQAGEPDSVTAGKAAAAGNPVVQKARNRWRDAKTDRKAMEIAFNNRERAANILSRELTRRTGGSWNQNRVGRNTP